MCGGEGTAMCGEPRVAAECTCTEREFGRCSRPTVRPGRTVHDTRDHGDGSDTCPRGIRSALPSPPAVDAQPGRVRRTMPPSMDGAGSGARGNRSGQGFRYEIS